MCQKYNVSRGKRTIIKVVFVHLELTFYWMVFPAWCDLIPNIDCAMSSLRDLPQNMFV